MGACIQQENDSSGERHEGIIVDIEKDTFGEIKYIVLSLPSVEDIDISGKSREELIGLAQENDGVFYHLSQEAYEELDLEIGKRIIGYYSAVGESNPPVLLTDKIEVISQ
ncbi:hypothetical protein [Alkalibacillus silvisoli]|uniref:hypothetical protein n=1 Tax=Alkalibacillus silvisoli TaxID=392823 RepID=UPI0031DBDA63